MSTLKGSAAIQMDLSKSEKWLGKEHRDIQQKQIAGPAAGEELHAWVDAGDQPAGKQLSREGGEVLVDEKVTMSQNHRMLRGGKDLKII